MKLYAKPFTYDSKGFQVLDSSPNDLSPYLIFVPTEVVLEPKQTRRVRLLARLLPSMNLGEYQSVIFAEPVKLPDNLNKKGGLSLNTRVGVVVYVRQGEIRESLIPKEINYDTKTKELYLSVHNEGNVTVRTQGKWELKQEGKQSLEGQIPTITVAAEGMRNIPITLFKDQKKENIPSGKYQLTGELFWGDPLNPTQVPFNFPVTIP
jgi:P pilus assembly chaperone PapD